MYCLIRHSTRFIYSEPIRENVMEVRLRPLDDVQQQCVHFALMVQPAADLFNHQDVWGNTVHHFDIPQLHERLEISAEATVVIQPAQPWPNTMPLDSWHAIDAVAQTNHWHFVHDSHFPRQTALLRAFAAEIGLDRSADPLTTLKQLNTTLYNAFDYRQGQTQVDSPIDDALAARAGVCQDLTHIMLALVRGVGIPCRYVSGYLMRNGGPQSAERSVPDESHAWVEAWLPPHGWLGFDPTNNLLVTDRHIRVAVGRDYADVTPVRGVFVGNADSQMTVGVYIGNTDAPAPQTADLLPRLPWRQTPRPVNSMWQAQQQQ